MVAYSDDIQVITKSLILKTLQPFFFPHFIFRPLPDSLFPSLYTSQSLQLISAVATDRACCAANWVCRAAVGTNRNASARRLLAALQFADRWQRFSSPIVRDASFRTIRWRFNSHHLATLLATLCLPPPIGDPSPPTTTDDASVRVMGIFFFFWVNFFVNFLVMIQIWVFFFHVGNT